MDSTHRPTATRLASALLLLVFLLATIAGSGCGDLASEISPPAGEADRAVSSAPGDAYDKGVVVSEEMAPAPEDGSSAGVGQDASTIAAEDWLVIRNAGVRLKVEDVDAAVEKLRAITADASGTISDLQVSTDDDSPVYRYDATGTLGDGAALAAYATVRVPATSLDDFLASVTGLGETLRQSASESDVTQEHVDLSARLKNLQAEEERLREFFDSAKSTTDMLAIEAELARVRGDIESMQAQIAYLERQAAMATVVVEFVGPEAVIKPAGEDWGFVDAIRTSIRAMVGTVNVLIIMLGGALPLIVLGVIAFFVIRAIVRRYRKRHPRQSTQTAQQYWTQAATQTPITESATRDTDTQPTADNKE